MNTDQPDASLWTLNTDDDQNIPIQWDNPANKPPLGIRSTMRVRINGRMIDEVPGKPPPGPPAEARSGGARSAGVKAGGAISGTADHDGLKAHFIPSSVEVLSPARMPISRATVKVSVCLWRVYCCSPVL